MLSGVSITNILNRNSFTNKRAFILAGGPSLKEFDFTPLQNEITIGINKSFVDFPVNYNISLDRTFLDIIYNDSTLYSFWKTYQGLKIFAKRRRNDIVPKDIHFVEVKGGKKIFVSLDIAKGIYCGNNSGYLAISFAVACGCKEIYLLGFDFTLGKNGETHYHSGYPGQSPLGLENKLWKFHIPFTKTASLMRNAGIEIVNLNPQSALSCYPFDELKNIL